MRQQIAMIDDVKTVPVQRCLFDIFVNDGDAALRQVRIVSRIGLKSDHLVSVLTDSGEKEPGPTSDIQQSPSWTMTSYPRCLESCGQRVKVLRMILPGGFRPCRTSELVRVHHSAVAQQALNAFLAPDHRLRHFVAQKAGRFGARLNADRDVHKHALAGVPIISLTCPLANGAIGKGSDHRLQSCPARFSFLCARTTTTTKTDLVFHGWLNAECVS